LFEALSSSFTPNSADSLKDFAASEGEKSANCLIGTNGSLTVADRHRQKQEQRETSGGGGGYSVAFVMKLMIHGDGS